MELSATMLTPPFLQQFLVGEITTELQKKASNSYSMPHVLSQAPGQILAVNMKSLRGMLHGIENLHQRGGGSQRAG